MESSVKKNILLGFFVIVGIIIFTVAIFMVGSHNGMFKKTFPVTTVFMNTTGLKTGSNVRYNGVIVGIVKSVTLVNDTSVRVGMEIDENKRSYITKYAIAAIASDGLMGDKMINLTPGKNGGAIIENNDVIASNSPLLTDKMFQTLGGTNENIKVITDNLKILTSDLNTKNGTLQSLYKDSVIALNLKQSFNNLNAITVKVLQASTALQQITSKVQNSDGTLNKLIDDTVMANNLSYTITRLKETSDTLISASGKLSETIQHANKGKGTVNMLLTDTAFSADVQQTVKNIKTASVGLNENMEALKHNFLTRRYFRKLAKKNKVSK